MNEPTVDELAQEFHGVDPEELRYIYWLRVGVREYLNRHTLAELKADWPAVRKAILTQNGYGSHDELEYVRACEYLEK